VKAQGLRGVLRRALWWFGLSVLIILGRAAGASGDPVDIVDTAQLADMFTRLASGIPLTMTTLPGDDEGGVADEELASADGGWARPEADYASIMQHALSGLTSLPRQPSAVEAKRAEPEPAHEPRWVPREGFGAPSGETEATVENTEPGVRVATAAVLPAVWIAAFGAPGLIAIVVSIFGIIINRPEPED